MSVEIESGDSPAENQYKRKTDEEVNELAKQGYRGEVFFSWQVREHDTNLIGSIFMPIMFLDDVTRKEWIRDEVCHFYGLMKDASPRGVNGYPMFFGMGILNKEDAVRIDKRIREIMELLGDFKPEESNG
jgi:hypothetical protein